MLNFIRSRSAALLFVLLLILSFISPVFVSAQSSQPNAQPNNGSAKATTSAPPGPPEVIVYLDQVISWYRHSMADQQLASEPSDILFVNDDRQIAEQVVRLAFDFARADAQLLAATPSAGTSAQQQEQTSGANRYQALINMASRADQQVKQAQGDLESLRNRLLYANGRTRRTIESAIAETQSELQLAQTRREVAQGMLEFVRSTNSSGIGSGGLRSQIDELERTVPAVAAKNANASPAATTSAAQPSTEAVNTRKITPTGMLALISDLVALSRKINALDDSIKQTDQLSQALKDIRAPLGGPMREMLQQADKLAAAPDSSDPTVLAQQKAELDSITAQFKQRSDAILPLIKQRILIDLYKRNLTNWRTAVNAEHTDELKSLIIRFIVLGIILAVVATGSELWRRTIMHYVSDVRRRYQLLLVRRIVVWFVIAVILAFAFASELGSLATFAGLITAGVAVALQNVILSVAGYFYLIGKYGVRVGDRVQIANVTGVVVDIGLVRLHLMELASGGSDAQPTGRVVVFSNSVVFQPSSGLFKQIPGTSFVWHEITLTLAPDSNYRAVEDRLIGAVEQVFNEYREMMDRQRRQMEKVIASVAVASLGPQSRLRLTQTGLEVVIRYPVDLQNAASVDDKMARALLDAIEREPKLKLVGSGTPNIQAVAEQAEVQLKR